MTTYAECNLEPLKCKFCGSLEVVFLQYVGDAQCAECGYRIGDVDAPVITI